jgi:hypothetical protein
LISFIFKGGRHKSMVNKVDGRFGRTFLQYRV